MLGLALMGGGGSGACRMPGQSVFRAAGPQGRGEISRSFGACLDGAGGLQRMEAACAGERGAGGA